MTKMLIRFLRKINKEGPVCKALNSQCWLWLGSKRGSNNYGQFWANGKNLFAHRVGYELFVGTVPSGKMVLHKCDTPLCVNPSHLKLGTHIENMEDRNTKGRQMKGDRHWARTKPHLLARGSDHWMAKTPGARLGSNNGRAILDETKVALIKKDLRRKLKSIKRLAREYNVNPCVIGGIKYGKTWKHVS